jgi:ribosomal protein S18 acetylase RimI-like enzyme
MDYVISALTAADEPILWEMLYQGLQTTGGEAGPSRDMIRRPEFARYVKGWGRVGDTGFLARDTNSGELLGAVWMRSPARARRETPELALAVKPGHRRRGIGATLLTQLVKANSQHSSVSIRGSANNPAVRLYERFGFKVVQQSEQAVTMSRKV